MGLTEGIAAPVVLLSRVKEVHPDQYTVDVETVFTHQLFTDVPISTLYSHKEHGGGGSAMPEEGADCYVMVSSDGTVFVMGFVLNPVNVVELENDNVTEDSPSRENDRPNFRNNRSIMEPGDVGFSTADGNFVILRRGGIVQIGATPLSQRLYIPIENLVRDYFQRYQAFSPIGTIEWGHAVLALGENLLDKTSPSSADYSLPEDEKARLDAATNTPVLVKYNIKEVTQENVTSGNYTVELRLGRLTEEAMDTKKDAQHLFGAGSTSKGLGLNQTGGILSLLITPHDTKEVAETVKYALQINRAGDAFMLSEGSLHIEVTSNVYMRVKGDMRMDVDGDLDLGTGADGGVTRGEKLNLFLTTKFTCMTAFGPSGPMTLGFDEVLDEVYSTTVKVKK